MKTRISSVPVYNGLLRASELIPGKLYARKLNPPNKEQIWIATNGYGNIPLNLIQINDSLFACRTPHHLSDEPQFFPVHVGFELTLTQD